MGYGLFSVFLMNDCGSADHFFLFYGLIPSINNALQNFSKIPVKLTGPQFALSILFSVFSLEEPSPISTIAQKPQLDFKKSYLQTFPVSWDIIHSSQEI